MHASEYLELNARHDPANAERLGEPGADPTAFVSTLRSIQAGAAADGRPWPETHLRPGRRMQLADADCALAGLTVVQEMLLAAERTRQNGPSHEYVGERAMEGMMMACLALTAQVSACLHVRS